MENPLKRLRTLELSQTIGVPANLIARQNGWSWYEETSIDIIEKVKNRLHYLSNYVKILTIPVKLISRTLLY